MFLQQIDNQVLIFDHYFSRRKWQLWGIRKNLQHLTRRIVRNILGVTSHKTQMLTDNKKTTSLRVSEEIEGRVTKKLSQEFRRTESCFLAALSRLDNSIMNPLIKGHSWTAPETSRNNYGTNQGTNEFDSQSDLHLEASISQSQTKSGPEDDHDRNTASFWPIAMKTL